MALENEKKGKPSSDNGSVNREECGAAEAKEIGGKRTGKGEHLGSR